MGYLFGELTEYRVRGFEAERAFWQDRVGLDLILGEEDYAILARAGSDFRLALRRADATATGVSVQFFCADIAAEAERLAARGLVAVDAPRSYDDAHPQLMTCGYKTPAGISFRLWANRLGL